MDFVFRTLNSGTVKCVKSIKLRKITHFVKIALINDKILKIKNLV